MSFSRAKHFKKGELKKLPIFIVLAAFIVLFAALIFSQVNASDGEAASESTDDSTFSQTKEELLKEFEASQGANSEQIKEAEDLLTNAFGDGKITVSTEKKDEALTTCVENYLESEKSAGESILLYQGYLGLFGNSWGCLLKDSQGVTLSIFSEKDNATLQENYRLLQKDWENAAA